MGIDNIDMDKRMKEFQKLAKPLVKWLGKNYDPQTMIIISSTDIRLVQDLIEIPVECWNIELDKGCFLK